MNFFISLTTRIRNSRHRLRHHLSDDRAVLTLSMLAIITGLLSGIVIQGFRLCLETPELLGFSSDFTLRTPLNNAITVFSGAMILAFFLRSFGKNLPSMGVAHVLDRMMNYHGRMPAKAAILQFFAASLCILTGQSSGREGPAIHFGAATSSLFAEWLKLPSNSIRILAGCGVASAIAASFNTPIAGVIFAMEVILLEYSIIGFIPVILAATSGTFISLWIYGDQPAFTHPSLLPHSFHELPLFILTGVAAGLLSAGFCYLSKFCLKFSHLSIITRFAIAGGVTALFGIFIPEILGIGYDNVNNAFNHSLSVQLLIGIVIAKLLTSCVSQGLGMPIGIIGPTLVVGACLGSGIYGMVNTFAPDVIQADALYPMIGMGAMMAAVMNAPLAALTALIELTGSTEVVLPAMVGIIIANLTCTQIFKQEAPHIIKLHAMGTHQLNSAFEALLERVGIAKLMTQRVYIINNTDISAKAYQAISNQKPRWIIFNDPEHPAFAVKSSALLAKSEAPTHAPLSIMDLSIKHWQLQPVDYQRSALEGYEQLKQSNVDCLLVENLFDQYGSPIKGIVEMADFENYFHKPRHF
ncbi:MAG: chloride channel protein [Cellvibrionales bacterium]|nr:chloride channel protein [Cellvibrionales bacterium]